MFPLPRWRHRKHATGNTGLSTESPLRVELDDFHGVHFATKKMTVEMKHALSFGMEASAIIVACELAHMNGELRV